MFFIVFSRTFSVCQTDKNNSLAVLSQLQGRSRQDSQGKSELRKFIRQIKELLRSSAKRSSPATAKYSFLSYVLTISR